MPGSVRNTGRGRYYARYISYYTKKNYALIGLGLLFLSGVFAGALFMSPSGGETRALLSRMSAAFVEARRGQAFGDIFASSASASMIFVGILFVCGFCAISQPLEIAAPFFKGIGFGVSAVCLYAAHGASAAAYIAVFMLPGTLVSTIATLFCCREALRLSGSFLHSLRKREGTAYPLRLYGARFLIASLACFLAAFIEAGLYVIFANFIVLR